MIDRAHELGNANYAVMFLDFDRFKLVNDSLGHDVGDALLQAIAERLQANVCPVDSVSRRARGNSVGRLGGDEFVVLLDDVQCQDDALAIADRLLAAFAQPYQLGEHEVYSTASMGILIGDLHYDLAADALRDADVAMYEAKQMGKARYVVFDESMRQVAERHLQLEHDLRKAVAGEQLSLSFEPVISLASGELVGVEAVVRWEHPVEGEIDPAEFVPLAEESDLIYALGTWALSAACQQMREWIDELGNFAPRMISINISRKQFARRDFADVVQQALTRASIAPDRLQIELSEDVLSGDPETALQTMHHLREQGIRFAIDNFCASNGSFAILHRLPIQMLKVDRSLLEHIEHSKYPASLLHALAVLVRNLGIALVANGVNRQSQWLALQELGCSAAQGSFVSERMNASAIEKFVIRDGSVALTTSGASAFANRLSETMSLEAL
jgi:diguanylate cyclase (GGDEF)-like protein